MSASGLPGVLLLRIARHLCSREACESAIVPLLADFQYEHARCSRTAEQLFVGLRWRAAFFEVLGVLT